MHAGVCEFVCRCVCTWGVSRYTVMCASVCAGMCVQPKGQPWVLLLYSCHPSSPLMLFFIILF